MTLGECPVCEKNPADADERGVGEGDNLLPEFQAFLENRGQVVLQYLCVIKKVYLAWHGQQHFKGLIKELLLILEDVRVYFVEKVLHF